MGENYMRILSEKPRGERVVLKEKTPFYERDVEGDPIARFVGTLSEGSLVYIDFNDPIKLSIIDEDGSETPDVELVEWVDKDVVKENLRAQMLIKSAGLTKLE